MRRIFVIFLITMASCTPHFREMGQLLFDKSEIEIPFDQSFLEYQVDMDSFAKLDCTLPDTLERIVFVGSSSIRMWKSLKPDMNIFPNTIVNRGFGGSTLWDVNYYFDDLVSPHQAEAVVLYCGENDISDGYKGQDVFKSFYTFLRLFLKNDPQSKLLFVSMKPSPARWNQWTEVKKGNDLIEQYIKRLQSPNIRYIDITKPMIDPMNQQPDSTIFLSDGLHMNEEGYQRWTIKIQEALWCLLGEKNNT